MLYFLKVTFILYNIWLSYLDSYVPYKFSLIFIYLSDRDLIFSHSFRSGSGVSSSIQISSTLIRSGKCISAMILTFVANQRLFFFQTPPFLVSWKRFLECYLLCTWRSHSCTVDYLVRQQDFHCYHFDCFSISFSYAVIQLKHDIISSRFMFKSSLFSLSCMHRHFLISLLKIFYFFHFVR